MAGHGARGEGAGAREEGGWVGGRVESATRSHRGGAEAITGVLSP